MEVVEGGRRACRDHHQAQTRMMSRPVFKKVQVVYYLSRNGHLEHPHYMEVSHLAHQQLRLKDVMDRLRSLRGKAIPSLYSWSCKRSYKNGYVWNDLSENDAIYPSEGAEYVLKGSELFDGCTDKLYSLQIGNGNSHQISGQESNLQPRIKGLGLTHGSGMEEMVEGNQYGEDQEIGPDEEDEEFGVKTSYTAIGNCNAAHSRCSRGVSTDEIHQKNGPSELSLDSNNSLFSSPPSTTSSDTINNNNTNNNNTSKRFEDGDPIGTEPLLNRNSMLLSLIACGGSASFRKTMPPLQAAVVKQSPARKSNGGGGSIHKGVVCKAAARAAEDDETIIGCMSENPRFGNLQSEEKEYFSGSIVESMGSERADVQPALKKSSSHNEERSNASGLGEAVDEEVERDNGLKGKCIPRKKASSKQSRK